MIYKFCFLIGIAIASFLIWLIVLNYQQTSSYKGPKSYHFDGVRFFNLTAYDQHGFFDVIKWSLNAHRAKWPSSIANKAIPDLHAVIGDQVKVTNINHSTLLVQTESFNFLTDPIWTDRASPITWLGPKRVRKPGVAINDLPPIDAIFVSHSHYDHLSLPTLKILADKFHPIIFVPLGLKNLLERHGIKNSVELDWWQTYTIKNTVVTLLPAQHWSQRGIGDKCKTLWGSYGIVIGNKHIYFGGDSGYSTNFKQILQKWGKPDLAFLPIGSYQPEWFMCQNHMNPSEAVTAHQDLQATHSIGIHFGTFQLSDEAIDQPIIDLHQAIVRQKLATDEFITLDVGQSRVY